MHELFINVLSKRDLSKAGDLFTISDTEIENNLTEVVRNLTFFLTYPINSNKILNFSY